MQRTSPQRIASRRPRRTLLTLAALGLAGAFSIMTGALLSATRAAIAAPENPQAPAEEPSPLLGKPAPDFTLPDQNDKPVKLSELKGKWVVLAFYPLDLSRGCTIQNESYSAHLGDFKPKNAVVYTISTQDTASKKEFVTKDNLKHTLLSDVGGKVAKEYDALREGTSYAKRWTFYVRPDGTVAYVDTKISVGTAAEDSLAILDKLSKGDK